MKKALIILLSLCCFAVAEEDKKRIAVYMAGEEPSGAIGVHRVLGGELARVISRSDRYTAVDRTDAIQSQLAKEHEFQRSGAVSDEQIKALGQQFGVQYLCIVQISALQGDVFYLDVRLVNVVTAEIVGTVTASSNLQGSAEMIRIARHTARELLDAESLKDEIRREETKRRTVFWTAVGLDVLGAGLLAYGLYEDRVVRNSVNNGVYRSGSEHETAKRSARNRNLGYMVGGAFLLTGISIHILF